MRRLKCCREKVAHYYKKCLNPKGYVFSLKNMNVVREENS